MSQLHFHIIYLPGTVTYLAPLVHSLLKWSDYTFCLVANGCPVSDEKALADFCKKNQRLSYLKLPFPQVVPHGEALNFLQKNNRADFFCFMDSDFFATGPFTDGISNALKSNQGVFSGTPLWCNEEEETSPQNYPRIYGRHRRTWDGRCLGGTYFAVYDNKTLSGFMGSYKDGFKIKRWGDISPDVQLILKKEGLEKSFYDTGKVLNILLSKKGFPLQFLNLPNLIHLGGFSRLHVNQSKSFLGKIKTALKKIKKGQFQMLFVQIVYWFSSMHMFSNIGFLKKSKLVRQVRVEQFLSKLLIALTDKGKLPIWKKTGLKELDDKMEKASQSLTGFFSWQ